MAAQRRDTRIDFWSKFDLAHESNVNLGMHPIWCEETELSIQSTIESKLTSAFSPERLAVINESHLHAGHQEHFDGTGETHFRVRIVAEAFAGRLGVEARIPFPLRCLSAPFLPVWAKCQQV